MEPPFHFPKSSLVLRGFVALGIRMTSMPTISSAVSHFLILLSILSLPGTYADGTVSLTNEPAFSTVRACVQDCLNCNEYWYQNCPDGAIGILYFLTCNNLDSCFCRTDFESSVSSYLTSCINQACSTHDIDLSAGMSLYNGYCGFGGATINNYPSQPTSNSPNIIDATTTLPASPGSTPTVVVFSTVTSTSDSSTFATSISEWPLKIMIVLTLAALVNGCSELLCT
jgi:hypothetical protein